MIQPHLPCPADAAWPLGPTRSGGPRRIALRRTVAWTTTLIWVAGLGACGGGGTKTSSSTVASGGTAVTNSTVKATGGGDFCKQVADSINTGIRSAAQGALTPDQLRQQYADSKQKSQAALKSAPSEIKPDLTILLDASNKLGDELAKVNFDLTKLPPSATSSFSTPQVQAASSHVLAFVKSRCGIDIGGTTTTSLPAP